MIGGTVSRMKRSDSEQRDRKLDVIVQGSNLHDGRRWTDVDSPEYG